MLRRTFLQSFAFAGEAKPPNILFLFADDMRHDTIQNTAVRTPNLDKLARRALTFSSAYIMGGTIPAVCAPSRAMLMTGQNLFHVDASIVRPKPGARPFTLFPEYLRNHGYATHGIGKWHNGENLYARAFTGGANIMFGGMSDHLKVPVVQYDPNSESPFAKRGIGQKFSSELFSDSAIEFLKTHDRAKPFCLYVAYTAPHDPRMAPTEFAHLYPPAKIKLPKNFLPEHPFDNGEMRVRDEALAPWPRTPAIVREHIGAYYAMITHLDHHIGRVVEALDCSGEADNTIIIFAADNGLAVGQHGLLGKQNMYDHSVRVPLMISAPNGPRGKRTNAMVYLHDLFPTLCELIGIPIPPTVETRSLAPILKGSKSKIRENVFTAYRDFMRAVRTESHKLIVYNVNGKITKQLFDMRRDPLEMKNLADDPGHQPRLAELTTLLKNWMSGLDDPVGLPL